MLSTLPSRGSPGRRGRRLVAAAAAVTALLLTPVATTGPAAAVTAPQTSAGTGTPGALVAPPQVGTFLVGGSTVASNKPYRYIASLSGPDGRHFCTGALVDDFWVLTAKHCVRNPPTYIRIGSFCWNRRCPGSPSQAVYGVNRIVAYPYNSDVALIRLPASARRSAAPVRIGKAPPVSTTVRMLGWGSKHLWGPSPTRLRQLDSKVVARASCGTAGEGRTGLCIDDPARPATSACHGDSGGPVLARQGARRQWRLVGVISEGTPRALCSGGTFADSVPALRWWIEQTIGHPLP